MKNYSVAYAAHLRQPLTTLAICWRVVKTDGEVILGTDHDVDIPITVTSIGMALGDPPFTLVGRYVAGAGITASALKGAADMSVDNMEVSGAVRRPDLYITDISIPDVRAGLYDGAQLTTFRVNYNDPDDFQEVLRHGTFGQINWDSDGGYKTEVRGLNQPLQQNMGRTAGETCDVEEFGDARCKLDVEDLSAVGTVTAVTSRRRFNASLDPGTGAPAPAPGYFTLGKMVWLTGLNVNYTQSVRNDSIDSTLGHIEVWEEFPENIDIGDTFLLRPGCDRRYTTCREVHRNILNFRGPGYFCPGTDSIIKAF